MFAQAAVRCHDIGMIETTREKEARSCIASNGETASQSIVKGDSSTSKCYSRLTLSHHLLHYCIIGKKRLVSSRSL